MGIFKRVSDIISANIHHLLDRCEDPERMCKQVVRELEETLVRVRGSVVRAMAGERQLRSALDQNRDIAREWAERAEEALRDSDEELTKRALRQKLSYQKRADELQEEWENAAAGTEELRTQFAVLEEKLREARRYRDMLIARKRAAEAKRQVQRSLDQAGAVEGQLSRMGRMAEVVRQLELEVTAEADLRSQEKILADRFQERREQSELDDEFEALRRRVSGSGTTPAGES